MLILLAACSKSVSPTTPSVSESPPAPAPAWAGSWVSASCGDRSYSRTVVLATDGAATVEDHISPCPEGARCMWSGILIAEGRWAPSEDAVSLEMAPPSGPAVPVDFPASFTWADDALQQGACAYTRQ